MIFWIQMAMIDRGFTLDRYQQSNFLFADFRLLTTLRIYVSVWIYVYPIWMVACSRPLMCILRSLDPDLNLPIEKSKKHILYLNLRHLGMEIGNNGQGTNSWGCKISTQTSCNCWDLCSNYNRREGPCFVLYCQSKGLESTHCLLACRSSSALQ